MDAAQHHTSEILNEEIANLLKRKIKASLTSVDELGMSFDYTGEAIAQDAEEILEKITTLHRRAGMQRRQLRGRNGSMRCGCFAANLEKAFYGFGPDFFQHNLLRTVDDVVSVIRASIELWPTLVEICYFQKVRNGLPMLALWR